MGRSSKEFPQAEFNAPLPAPPSPTLPFFSLFLSPCPAVTTKVIVLPFGFCLLSTPENEVDSRQAGA